jgi:hypothetical protein
VEGHKVLRNYVLLCIYPAMLESAVCQLGAVQKLALHKLQIAEARAVGKGCEHAGWYRVPAVRIINEVISHVKHHPRSFDIFW